ncbi:MAG TPA: hypothetical protein VM681_09775 [Candidatus Thermoplasmatota archaeon]|nr:hypothetical protein [Candidatus Thermoplasmatota archaeon]
MPLTSAFLASSLDGLIARRDGGLEWLPGSGADGAEAAAASDDDEVIVSSSLASTQSSWAAPS